MPRKIRGLTLLELIFGIVLMSIIVLGLMNIDYFSHFHVLSANRRTTLQNAVAISLDHMAKEIGRAIGDITVVGGVAQFPVTIDTMAGNPRLRVWVDQNANGRRDPSPTDQEIAYVLANNQMQYYANCCVGVPEVIATRFTDFIGSIGANNYDLNVRVRACWDPATAPAIGVSPDGTPDNPCVVMTTNIRMPSVSAH